MRWLFILCFLLVLLDFLTLLALLALISLLRCLQSLLTNSVSHRNITHWVYDSNIVIDRVHVRAYAYVQVMRMPKLTMQLKQRQKQRHRVEQVQVSDPQQKFRICNWQWCQQVQRLQCRLRAKREHCGAMTRHRHPKSLSQRYML